MSFHVGGLLAAEGETCFALAGVGRWAVVDLLPKLKAELPKLEAELPKLEAELPKLEVELPKLEVELPKLVAEL